METIIKNIKISYIDDGKGDITILFLHGWGAKKENFLQSIDLLKQKYRCIAIDFPGFGESGELERSFDVDDYVNIVDEFLKKLEIKKVIFVGHSFGGRVIIKLNNLCYAKKINDTNFEINIKNKCQINKVCDKNDDSNTRNIDSASDIKNVCNENDTKKGNYEIIKNIFIDSAGIKHAMPLDKKLKVDAFKTMKNILDVIPGSETKKKERIDKLRDKFGSADYKNAKPIMRETLVKVVNEDLKDLLKNIKVESLLIWGENDKDTPLSDAKIFEKEIKNSGLVVLKNTAHFSFIEDSYTYLRVMESYLLKR